MKILILASILMLTGCFSTAPVKRNFPEVPQELMDSCPDLKMTSPTTKLSDTVKVVAQNYSQYHECRAKVDAWNEWYKTQKQIFESAN